MSGAALAGASRLRGARRGDADFSNFNDAMLEYWSFQCGAFWPCSTAAAQ
jgi:hypothetical protein